MWPRPRSNGSRNGIRRAWSTYVFAQRRGRSPGNFLQANGTAGKNPKKRPFQAAELLQTPTGKDKSHCVKQLRGAAGTAVSYAMQLQRQNIPKRRKVHIDLREDPESLPRSSEADSPAILAVTKAEDPPDTTTSLLHKPTSLMKTSILDHIRRRRRIQSPTSWRPGRPKTQT